MIRSERGSARERASEQGGLGRLVLGRRHAAQRRQASIERKPPPFYSRSRGLGLLLFGWLLSVWALLSSLSGEKRTEIKADANSGRRRPSKEQDDTPYATLGERRRRRLLAWACSFLLWVRLVIKEYSCHLLRPSRRCCSAASTGLSSLLVATASIHSHRLPQLSLCKCG